MGNTQPTNHTGRKVVSKKLEHASKTGILSLTEHSLDQIPTQVFEIRNLKTLDVSKNKIKKLGIKLASLKELKSLNCDDNLLEANEMSLISSLTKLQSLSLGGNQLGEPSTKTTRKKSSSSSKIITNEANNKFPPLPPSLKQLKLNNNNFLNIPSILYESNNNYFCLTKLEKLDISNNNLAVLPEEISNLLNLSELNADDNAIVELPNGIGELKKLKTLSLKNNQISAGERKKSYQPLPELLFTNTLLIDLNLHNNPLSSTQFNEMNGTDSFLERRKKIKTKNIYGGALTNLDVCGLK